MDSHDIRKMAQSMANEIQSIVESYNRLDPAFAFYPVISITETDTTAGGIKAVSVNVQVGYNTKEDRTPFSSRQFTQVDTSKNAFMEGSLTKDFDRVNSSDKK
jgi:hypothetical protein